jgi:hypothetical protein
MENDIKNLTFYGNKSFTNIKSLLIINGVKKFRNVRKNVSIVDDTVITTTRFEFRWNKTLYFAICEPKLNIFKIDINPIK